MASLVMRQLEMTREVSERQRAMKMGRALSSFVEGKVSITPLPNQEQVRASSFESHLERPTKAMSFPEHQAQEPAVQPPQDIGAKLKSAEMSHPTLVNEETASEPLNPLPNTAYSTSSDGSDQGESVNSTFARATYLIREALEVQGW